MLLFFYICMLMITMCFIKTNYNEIILVACERCSKNSNSQFYPN